MSASRALAIGGIASLLLSGCLGVRSEMVVARPAKARIALFNVMELSAGKIDELDAGGAGKNPQLLAAAQIIQQIRPDVLVLQEIDLPQAPDGSILGDAAANARRFADLYLARGAAPLAYPHAFAAPTNTGVLSGIDLNGDGYVATPADRGDRRHGDDCFGYGAYPGQYSMAVLSRFPLATTELRSFQRFPWRDLPGHHLPAELYPAATQELLRLSSKSHWDLPIQIGEGRLHLLVSHPTPPAFDGPEDRNGRRNFDEIRLWRLYLDGEPSLVDDQGRRGGYGSEDPFVVVGDLNASPYAADTLYDGRTAISQLLEHPRVQDTGSLCISRGGLVHGGAQPGPPAYAEQSTAEFLGGRRVDYVLPSKELGVLGGGVHWPAEDEDPAGHARVNLASDHHLVWVDLALPPQR